ncbi:MAG: hypothetical protein EON87_02240, partial [Brevundimonas sp.]
MTVAAWLMVGALAVQPGAQRTFDVQAGAAVPAINRLASQAGIDVVIAANLSTRRTEALRGRMTTEAALDRMLRPLGARAVRIGEGVYRIDTAPRQPLRPASPPPPAVVVLP